MPASASHHPSPAAPTTGQQRAVGLWLGLSAAMVLVMMAVGAITRLTESGLSMVEWRPLLGWLPPLGEEAWQRVFGLYQQTSQYRLQNFAMSLPEFQQIFWWEYIHRLWGRLIGLVFALPLAFFWWRGWVAPKLRRHMLVLLLLGALQGAIGWWMVTSGFVDRTEVSHYRLAVHLGMAFFIFAYLLWLAIPLLFPIAQERPAVARPFRRLGAAIHGVIFFTVLSGALVAGLNAGLIANNWPLMGEGFLPESYWLDNLGWRSLIDNPEAVQLHHRLMAYGTLLLAAFLWGWSRRQELAPRAKRAIGALLLMVCLQLGLGISTLLSQVWLPLAVLHQIGAAISFGLAIWVMVELRGHTRWRAKE